MAAPEFAKYKIPTTRTKYTMLVQYALTFCRITICLVFVWSLLGKVQNISSFIQTIKHFQLLPELLHRPAAIVFLGGELAVLGTMILGGKLLSWGFLLAGSLLMLFNIALVSTLIRKIQTPCNCFGSREKLVSAYDVVRNLIVILCTLGGWQLYLNSNAQSNLVNSNLLELSLIGLTSLVFILIVINLTEIIHVFK